jgi:GDPmannose 4,6-dehydratase
LILQQEEPDDYVIGTGESHSVREFVELAFAYAGIILTWQGKSLEEKGVVKAVTSPSTCDLKTGDVVVEIDPHYFRPAEVDFLCADASKALERLDWKPKVTFHDIIKVMVDSDLELAGIKPPGEGKKILIDKKIGWTTNKITIQ